MNEEDITTLITDDDVAQVLTKCKENLPIYYGSVERGLDFANALLYHLEDALEAWFGIVTTCKCLSSLRIADIHRGYCSNCFTSISVNVSGKAIDT